MSVYTDAAYSPRINTGTLLFNDSPKILLRSIDVQRRNRVAQFEIPQSDGIVLLPSSKGGLSIIMGLQIATTDLDDLQERLSDLEEALAGDADSKFTFYLRYVDSNNYWAYNNCVCMNFGFATGKHNPKLPDLNTDFEIELLSEDSVPVIKESGSLISGDTSITEVSKTIIGATDILITDSFLIQNTQGDIVFSMSAATSQFNGTGTISFTL